MVEVGAIATPIFDSLYVLELESLHLLIRDRLSKYMSCHMIVSWSTVLTDNYIFAYSPYTNNFPVKVYLISLDFFLSQSAKYFHLCFRVTLAASVPCLSHMEGHKTQTPGQCCPSLLDICSCSFLSICRYFS